MNTVTLSETQALQAAVTTPVVEAIVTATYRLLLIPLSHLRPSSRNVRQSGGASIPELASSIDRVGLLQNLTVTACSDGEHYEVVAGKRRLAALKLLAKRHKIDKAHDVPCLLVRAWRRGRHVRPSEAVPAPPVRQARWLLVRSLPTRRVPPHPAVAVFALRGPVWPTSRRVVRAPSASVLRPVPRPSRTASHRSFPGRLHRLQPQVPQLAQAL